MFVSDDWSRPYTSCYQKRFESSKNISFHVQLSLQENIRTCADTLAFRMILQKILCREAIESYFVKLLISHHAGGRALHASVLGLFLSGVLMMKT